MEGQCKTDGLSSQQVVLQHEGKILMHLQHCRLLPMVTADLLSLYPPLLPEEGLQRALGTYGALKVHACKTGSRCHAHELARSGCLALH